jgi:hypothetical protein
MAFYNAENDLNSPPYRRIHKSSVVDPVWEKIQKELDEKEKEIREADKNKLRKDLKRQKKIEEQRKRQQEQQSQSQKSGHYRPRSPSPPPPNKEAEAVQRKQMLERLGLQASETNVDTIKRAFRTLALRVHPDKTGGSDTEFKRVLEAYEYLCMH